MKPSEIERAIRQVAWPDPAPDLRGRVLASARLAADGVTWADRIWFSRAWRLACAASVVGAIGVASLDTRGVDATVAGLPAQTEAQGVADVARTLGLPPELSASLARRTLERQARPLVPSEDRVAPDVPPLEGDRR